MGRYEDEQAEAENAILIAELTRRNPLGTKEQAKAWGRVRDDIDLIRANADGIMEEFAEAVVEFYSLNGSVELLTEALSER